MNLSTNTRYAIRLIFELQKSTTPVSIAVLSEKIGISLKTAEKIHAILKKNKITDAILGPKGGVILKKDLNSISLGLMIKLFDGGVHFNICHGNKANECPNQFDCSKSSTWEQASHKIQEELDNITLSKILTEQKSTNFHIPKFKMI